MPSTIIDFEPPPTIEVALATFRFPDPDPATEHPVQLVGGPFADKTYPMGNFPGVETLQLLDPLRTEPWGAIHYDRRVDESGVERWVYRQP